MSEYWTSRWMGIFLPTHYNTVAYTRLYGLKSQHYHLFPRFFNICISLKTLVVDMKFKFNCSSCIPSGNPISKWFQTNYVCDSVYSSGKWEWKLFLCGKAVARTEDGPHGSVHRAATSQRDIITPVLTTVEGVCAGLGCSTPVTQSLFHCEWSTTELP